MKMILRYSLDCFAVFVLSFLLASPPSLFAQGLAQDHVVSPAEIQKDLAASSQTRERNQEQIIRFLSTRQAREAMRSAHVDYVQVTNAVSMLSNAEMAQLAARSNQAQKDFAAGTISNHDLLLLTAGIAVLILIIVAVR